jgi:ABC-type multidrug transport system fused ATPase/permease subunit
MLTSWLGYFKQGIRRGLPEEGLGAAAARASLGRSLKNLRPFLGRHWKKGLAGAGLILLATVLAFPMPMITRYLVDTVILGKRLDLLLWAMLALGGAKLLSMGAGALEDFFFTRFEQDVLLDIQQRLIEHTLRLPKSFFDGQETGYLMSRTIADVQNLRWFFSSTLVYVATNLLRFAGGIVFLFYLEWRLGLVTLVALPTLVLSVRFFATRLHALSHRDMEQEAQISQRVEETLSSTTLIKAFGAETRETERIVDELQSARQISLEQSAVTGAANLAISAMPDVAKAVVLVAGAIWIIRGEWTLGSLLAFQAYLGYVYSPATALANFNLQLQNALAALQRVSALFDLAPEENLGKGVAVERLQGELELDRVSFAYPGEEAVLEDLSLRVRPGETAAIAGSSGVGKTTLVSLLLQFYKPTSGEIRFDGRPAGEYELGALRRRIGYVMQTNLLLSGTIRENLCYGNQGVCEEEMVRAAKTAGAHEFIQGLPGGFDAPIGERGVNLSEGEKQRLAIARALIKDPDILILDEPTSALDGQTERTILDQLPQALKGKTLLVVSHRPATLRRVERVFLIESRRLAATGSHEELMASCPEYAALAGEH